jgi:hypothetical protein
MLGGNSLDAAVNGCQFLPQRCDGLAHVAPDRFRLIISQINGKVLPNGR